MNKPMKKIVFGCLSFIIVATTMIGCGPNNVKEKETEKIELTYIDEDGTKINKSDKVVNETKKLGELEFKNISIKESGNLTKLEFDAYNSSEKILYEKEVTIVLLNEKNEEIKRLKNFYIGTISPKQTVKGRREITLDHTEVYDIKFLENK
ncbi:MAG: hypothetical protein IKK43_02765 [Clostridia bacterium]|nr:hypothetical protein [Clostridia bacterium]